MVYMAGVAEKEGVEIDNTSLNIIAQKADGSMRDALSIFDQVVSFSGKVVDYRAIIENLNVLDYEYYFRMTQAFLDADYTTALKIFDEVLENGFEGRNYLSGLGKHFRNLLMCKDEETIQLMELSGEIADQYKSYSRECTVDFLLKSLKVLGTADIHYKQAKDTRLYVEITLLKLSTILSEPAGEEIALHQKKRLAEKSTVKHEIADKKDEAQDERQEDSQAKEEKPVESKKNVSPPPGGSIPLKTGPRITDFLNGSRSDPAADEIENQVKEEEAVSQVELNQENLDILWDRFANEIREDQPRLFNTLTTQKPVLEENGLIRLDLNNPLQEKALASIHFELLAFLKKNTGNQDIRIETLVPQDNSEKKLYTADEKFKHMQEQNPQLGLFKNTFNLDFE